MFHILCCVATAAGVILLAGIVVLILRSLSGTLNLQLGQFGNNCGMFYSVLFVKIYIILRLYIEYN